VAASWRSVSARFDDEKTATLITFSRLGKWGRLGNQMYEYAALLGIGMKLGYEIAIPPHEQHALDSCFDVTAPILSERDLRKIRHVFQEPRYGYSERFWSIEDYTDLRGFFRSEFFFPPREVVKREFAFKPELVEAAAEFLQPWRDEGREIVGMAVRRGDFALFPEHFVQLWETDFFDRALAEFDGLDRVVVVSSNEPDWCRQRFAGERLMFPDSLSDTEQLAMFTLCDHMIVSNSTFSWWGAWLNDRPGRRIAPSRWRVGVLEAQRDPLPVGWEALEI
jgi:Glycosyl transferase family 11